MLSSHRAGFDNFLQTTVEEPNSARLSLFRFNGTALLSIRKNRLSCSAAPRLSIICGRILAETEGMICIGLLTCRYELGGLRV
jgi:hypothetical protein